jgi:antitoxin ParD1/3/4
MRFTMATLARLNATIPQPLSDFADIRVESGNFGNKSEYIRHLIRQDLEAAKVQETQLLNKMIRDGIDSGISPKTPEEILAGANEVIEKARSRKS